MILPGFSIQRLVLLMAASTLFFGTGISIFSRPHYEVFFSKRRYYAICEDLKCYAWYGIEVGNSGKKTQHQIAITFDPELVAIMTDDPRAYAAGVIRRPLKKIKDRRASKYLYGELKPGRKVVIRFALTADSLDKFPLAEDLAIKIEPEKGRALIGSSEFVTLVRFFAFFI
jgi:hypothetical protein